MRYDVADEIQVQAFLVECLNGIPHIKYNPPEYFGGESSGIFEFLCGFLEEGKTTTDKPYSISISFDSVKDHYPEKVRETILAQIEEQKKKGNITVSPPL